MDVSRKGIRKPALGAWLSLRAGRCCESVIGDPAVPVKAIPQCLVCDAEFTRPFREALSSAIETKVTSVASIAGLLRLRSPTAIFWIITKIIVDPVNRVFVGRTKPHVYKEGDKAIPPFADSDPPSAVIGVDVGCRAVASLSHGVPCNILRRMDLPVSGATATRASVTHASKETTGRNIPFNSTDALASPVSTFGFTCVTRDKVNDGPLVKDSTSQVFEVRTLSCRIIVSHLNLLCRFMVVRAAGRSNPSGCLHYTAVRAGGQCHAA